MSDDPALGPEDPTPPQGTPVDEVMDVEGGPPSRKATTFLDVAKVAADEVTADGKIDVQEVLDAGVAAARQLGIGADESGEHPPLAHHAITELRKFLVPILTTLIGFVGGGGIGLWRGEVATEEAVQQVRETQREDDSERDKIREEVQRMIRERVREHVGTADWDSVGRTVLDPEGPILRVMLTRHSDSRLGEDQVRALTTQQIQAAQCALPAEDVALQPDTDVGSNR